jgi:CHAD domain-containing protein
MKAAAIEKILEREIKKVKKDASKISPHFFSEDIHDLRVAVKRLRAFLRFLASDKKQPAIKLPRKFKSLYHYSGFIREAQLEGRMLTEWKMLLPSYSRALQSETVHYTKQWDDHFAKNVLKELEKKLLQNKFKPLATSSVIFFFRSSIERMSQLLEKSPEDEDIHTFRKIVKDMLYLSKIIRKNWPLAYKKLNSFPMAQLDKLSTAIGNFNDGRIILVHLVKFNNPRHSEFEKLATLCKTLKEKEATDRAKLLKQMKRFIIASDKWLANQQ